MQRHIILSGILIFSWECSHIGYIILIGFISGKVQWQNLENNMITITCFYRHANISIVPWLNKNTLYSMFEYILFFGCLDNKHTVFNTHQWVDVIANVCPLRYSVQRDKVFIRFLAISSHLSLSYQIESYFLIFSLFDDGYWIFTLLELRSKIALFILTKKVNFP